jgi:hypothetical protein
MRIEKVNNSNYPYMILNDFGGLCIPCSKADLEELEHLITEKLREEREMISLSPSEEAILEVLVIEASWMTISEIATFLDNSFSMQRTGAILTRLMMKNKVERKSIKGTCYYRAI